MILSDIFTAIKMPRKNKKCPCESKKRYKECCYNKDLNKKYLYIDTLNNMLNGNV